jgi:menaquinone-dependent protoporphyrinogen IX oxidase
MKGIIIYKGKYGATRDYAALLGRELSLPVFSDASQEQLAAFDYLLIGSSVYIGQLQLKAWLKHNEGWLRNKKLYFFIVCGTPEAQKEKTAVIVADNIPASLQRNPIFFLRGRMIKKQLSWKDRTLLKLGAWLTKDPQQKMEMLQDFDEVHVSQIRPILQTLKLADLQERQQRLRASY